MKYWQLHRIISEETRGERGNELVVGKLLGTNHAVQVRLHQLLDKVDFFEALERGGLDDIDDRNDVLALHRISSVTSGFLQRGRGRLTTCCSAKYRKSFNSLRVLSANTDNPRSAAEIRSLRRLTHWSDQKEQSS